MVLTYEVKLKLFCMFRKFQDTVSIFDIQPYFTPKASSKRLVNMCYNMEEKCRARFEIKMMFGRIYFIVTVTGLMDEISRYLWRNKRSSSATNRTIDVWSQCVWWIHSVRCHYNAVSQIFTKDSPKLANLEKIWGVLCGTNIWLMFCLTFCDYSCSILQYWIVLLRHSTVYPIKCV